jgi:hypothetical protein
MHGCSSLQVGKCEVRLSISSIGCAQQREQRRILGQRQELPIAPSPALGGEVERKDADLCNEWIGHGFLLGRRWKDAEQRNNEVDAEIRLKVGVGLAAPNG